MAFKRSAVRSRLSPPQRCAEYFYIDAVSLDTAIFVFGDKMEAIDCVNEYRAYAAVEAMQKISELAKEFGLDDMSLEEINAEISAARAERTEQSE